MNDPLDPRHGSDFGSADDAVSGIVTRAISARAHQLHSTEGSLRDVHARVRRNARRRTAVGVGAMAVVGVAGAVVWSGRGGSGSGPRLDTGAGGGATAGPADATAGYWVCSGLLSAGQGPVPWTVVSVAPTTIEPPTVLATEPPEYSTTLPEQVAVGQIAPRPTDGADGPYYMRDCRFVDVSSATTPIVTVLPIDPTSTILLAPPTSLLVDMGVTSTIPGTVLGSTIPVVGESATTVPPTTLPPTLQTTEPTTTLLTTEPTTTLQTTTSVIVPG